MPTVGGHSEEFKRIGSMEHNVAIDQTDMFGPSRRFEKKGQMSNPSSGGGINRSLKGKGKAKKRTDKSAQGRDNGPRRFGSKEKGKVSHAAKHKGAGG